MKEMHMGSIKLDLRCAPINFHKSVEKYFKAAFSPSPSLYRQVTLCGWRPLVDHRGFKPLLLDQLHPETDATFSEKPVGIAVYETADGMTIEVALDEIREESLHLAISGKMVIIRGERIIKQAQYSLGRTCRPNTRFKKQIQLPATVSSGAFRAQLDGDIIRIVFSKR
jgi:HSP20 family molecular chaperone IbpA